MTSVQSTVEGIEVVFADGVHGLIPFADLPEVGAAGALAGMELPNPYELILRSRKGPHAEVPWDFARAYCDPEYRPRTNAIAEAGLQAIGERIRSMRERAGVSQQRLAARARIGRITLVRLEGGEQSPRYDTLASLADALGVPLNDLLAGER